MKKVLLASLFPLFLLVGCSGSNSGEWSKSGMSAEMAAQDREQCEAESRSSANNSLHADPLTVVNTDSQVSQVLESEQHQFNLVGECMRAKGYNNF